MIITNCPRCGAMNATTTCANCGWSQFTTSTVSTGVLLDDYKRLLLENRNLKERIAELEEENDRLQDAWFKDETICPDGSLKPKVSTLLSRIAELTECIGSQMADVYTLKAHIAELEAAQRWIPVSERLPEDRATILAAFTEYPEQIDILTATYYKRYEGFGGVDNWWDIEGWHSGNVTHWMPLPQPPEERER